MKLFYSILLLLISIPSYSQNALSFEKSTHNFGKIKENAGIVRTSFSFKNVSSSSIKIQNISVSCGCTSPSWPKGQIEPGATNKIEVTFNPLNRPGEFDKSIDLVLDNNSHIQLNIKGDVVPKDKGLRDFYPILSGNLWFEATSLISGSLHNDSSMVISTKVYNPTSRAITIDWNNSSLPAYISPLIKRKQIIYPQDSLKISVVYHGNKRKDWGFLTDKFTILTDDTDTPNKQFTILLHLKERFSDKGPYAKLQLENKEHNFGRIGYDSSKRISVKVTNTGKKTLFIRKILNKCDCLSFRYSKKGIPPGGSALIRVTLNTEEHVGEFVKAFSIISNDPQQTSRMYLLKAYIGR